MKSGGPLRRTPLNRAKKPLQAKTRMKQVSSKKRAYRGSEEGKAGAAIMADRAQEPCIICRLHGEVQVSRTTIHHPIHDRVQTDSDEGFSKQKGSRRASDERGLPICDGHHQGDFDTSKVSLHREPEKWKRLYGNDYDYLDRLGEML